MKADVAGVLDQQVPDERELVAVDALVHQGAFGELLLGDLGLTPAAGLVTPALDERLAVALDREHPLVGVAVRDAEAGLGTAVQRVVHAVLLDAAQAAAVGPQGGVDVDVLNEDHRSFAALATLEAGTEVEGLGLGDLPLLGLVVRGVQGHQRELAAVDGVLQGKRPLLEGIAEALQGLLGGIRAAGLRATAGIEASDGKGEQDDDSDDAELAVLHFLDSIQTEVLTEIL